MQHLIARLSLHILQTLHANIVPYHVVNASILIIVLRVPLTLPFLAIIHAQTNVNLVILQFLTRKIWVMCVSLV